MPEVRVRKKLILVEEIFHEGGPVAAIPQRRGAALHRGPDAARRGLPTRRRLSGDAAQSEAGAEELPKGARVRHAVESGALPGHATEKYNHSDIDISLLGNPDKTEKVDLELETQKKTMAITRYFYIHDGQTVVLHFQNGRLINEPEKLKE